MADDDVDIVGDLNSDLNSGYDTRDLPENEADLGFLDYSQNPWMVENSLVQSWYTSQDDNEKSLKTVSPEKSRYLSTNKKTAGLCTTSSSSLTKSAVAVAVSRALVKTLTTTTNNNNSKKVSATHKKPWNDKEKEQFLKGMELYGRSWTKISNYMGSRTSLQVKNFARQFLKHREKQAELLKDQTLKGGKSAVSNSTTPEKTGLNTYLVTSSSVVTVSAVPALSKVVSVKSTGDGAPAQPKGKKHSLGKLVSSTTSPKPSRKSAYKSSKKTEPAAILNFASVTHNCVSPCSKSNDTVVASAALHNGLDADDDSMLADQDCLPTDDIISSSSSITISVDPSFVKQEIVRLEKESFEDEMQEIDVLDWDSQNMMIEHPFADVLLLESTSGLNSPVTANYLCDRDEEKNICKPAVSNSSLLQLPNSILEQRCATTVDRYVKKENQINLLPFMLANTSAGSGSCPEKPTIRNVNSHCKEECDPDVKVNSDVDTTAIATPQIQLEGYDYYPMDKGGCRLIRDEICDLERLVHREFFVGRRSTKTPERYLKIRDYIMECWDKSKPNYLYKTAVRPGLKHCGDVNCISRIHAFLEQISAINIGCAQSKFYGDKLILPSLNGAKEKLPKHQDASVSSTSVKVEKHRNPRKRKSPLAAGESGNGGSTIEHSEGCDAVVISGFSEDADSITMKVIKEEVDDQDPFTLVPYANFNSEFKMPYEVVVELEAAIVMDIHFRSTDKEVAGLLGGRLEDKPKSNSPCSSSTDNADRVRVLRIIRAEPCLSNSSSYECDIDPVSQTVAGESLQSKGYDLIGWYHSHPKFPNRPSLRDLDTQLNYQKWFSSHESGRPFLGVIVSEHNEHNNLQPGNGLPASVKSVAKSTSPLCSVSSTDSLISNNGIRQYSSIKCFIAREDAGSNPTRLAYKFPTRCDNVVNMPLLLEQIRGVVGSQIASRFLGLASDGVSRFDKMAVSLEQHMQRAGCDAKAVENFFVEFRAMLHSVAEGIKLEVGD